jgi:hypothetical protein
LLLPLLLPLPLLLLPVLLPPPEGYCIAGLYYLLLLLLGVRRLQH